MTTDSTSTDQAASPLGSASSEGLGLAPERDAHQQLAAILLATPEALQELLQLPAGAYIDSVYAPHDRPGMLELRIRGAGWRWAVGQAILRTTPTVTQHHADDGAVIARVVDWGFPGDHTTPNAEVTGLGRNRSSDD